MYRFRETEKAKLLQGRTVEYVAKKIGITRSYLSTVLHGKANCSKMTAYCIVKCLCWEAEIDDYFDRVEG